MHLLFAWAIVLFAMTPKLKKLPDTYMRWTDHDEAVIRAIQLKLGITKVPELVRQSLRALADKEGLSA